MTDSTKGSSSISTSAYSASSYPGYPPAATSNASPAATTPTYFIGVWGNNTLTGYGANEVFYSPGGKAVMTGAGSKDTYIADGNTQSMEVTNFNPAHDVLNIYSSTGVSSLSSLLAHAKMTSAGLEIDFSSGSKIILDGVSSVSALSASNVTFSQGAYTPPNTNVPLSALTAVAPNYIIEAWGSHTVTGTGATELFFAPGGTEKLTGGGTKDIYVVDSTTQKMEITNFNPAHDVLYIGSSSGVDSLPTMMSHIKLSTAGSLEIDLPSGAQIVLDGVKSADSLSLSNIAFFAGAFTPPAKTATPPVTTQPPVTTPPALPLAGAANAKLNTNAWIPAGSIYAATQAQGSSSEIVSVKFTDTAAGGIHFEYSDGTIFDNTSVTLSPSRVSNLHLDAGTTPGDYTFQVAVMDAGGHWSAPATGHVTVVGVAPIAAIGG